MKRFKVLEDYTIKKWMTFDKEMSVIFQFEDGEVECTVKDVVFNKILWIPLKQMKITPSKKDFFFVGNAHESMLNECWTIVIKNLLKDNPDFDPEFFLMGCIDGVTAFNRFASKYTRAYASTLDLVGLLKMKQDPKIKKICNTKLDIGQGFPIAEQIHDKLGRDFIKLITTTGAIDNNMLLDFTRTDTINLSQLKQFFIAYGPRADIDDKMISHIIEESALSGIKDFKDFYVEGFSVKKSSHSSQGTISDAQYFNRRLKLACLGVQKIYKGSCGNKQLLRTVIIAKYKKYYLDKVIYDKGKRIVLTKETIENYLDKPIDMVSPLLCRKVDGVCEQCVGRGSDDFSKWNPKKIHIGIYAAALLAASASQLVLSAKHLIKTISLVLKIAKSFSRIAYVKNDMIFLSINKETLDSLHLRVRLDEITSLNDINTSVVYPEAFSAIKKIEFLSPEGTKKVDLVEHEDFVLYLSEDFLKFMKKHLKKIVTHRTFIDIPLAGWNIENPLLCNVAFNNDMRRFNKRVRRFLDNDLCRFTSLHHGLTKFLDIFYDKSGLEVPYIEIVLKAFISDQHIKDGEMIIEDQDNMVFRNIYRNIDAGPISSKLSFEGMVRYFQEIETYTEFKSEGWYDRLYNL